MKSHLIQVLRVFFSFQHIKYIFSSYGHMLFESALWRMHINAGKKIRIHPTASLRNPKNIFIDDYSHINFNCCVWAGKSSRIILGKNVLMGPSVQLHASKHGTSLGLPMMNQSLIYKDIIIGNDVWLCAGSIITAGVKIANGVIVAANAVVTKSILDENVIVAGIPAKIIGNRTET